MRLQYKYTLEFCPFSMLCLHNPPPNFFSKNKNHSLVSGGQHASETVQIRELLRNIVAVINP